MDRYDKQNVVGVYHHIRRRPSCIWFLYLSFTLGFTLHTSVRNITASTWPERQKTGDRPTTSIWHLIFSCLNIQVGQHVTFCSSNMERCAGVVVCLFHVHSREGKPGGVWKDRMKGALFYECPHTASWLFPTDSKPTFLHVLTVRTVYVNVKVFL